MRRYGDRWGTLNTVSTILFAVTALRLLTMCLSQPIAAYANNYDFVRQSSCVGVWQHYADRDKTASDPERPVNQIIYDGDRRPQVCLRSSDNIFPWVVAKLAGPGATTELRMVGLTKAIVALGVLAALLLQPMCPRLRCGLALVGALVFGDFAVGLYFDTLYLEASVLIFLTCSSGLAVAAYCGFRRPNLFFLFLLAFAIAWLAFARQQYSLFSAFIGGLSAIAILLRWRAVKAGAAIMAVVFGTQLGFQELVAHPSDHTRQVDHANRSDTFLGAVLPAATDPIKALRVAKLPASCSNSIGKDWYSPGFQQTNPCPDVYVLSRLRLLDLFVFDPKMFTTPLLRVIADSRPSVLPYLGHFERQEDAGRIRFRLLAITSLSTWLAALPATIYLALIAGCCCAGPFALGFLVLRWLRHAGSRGDVWDGALFLAGLGGAMAFYALISSVFGDGYYEVQRHALGVLLGIAFLVGAITVAALARLLPARSSDDDSSATSISRAA